ncbi:cation efflux protein: zinc transporter [Echinococcus multilocularis]|uniref:Cation efflux protein: zinc transporter n=1 Tax=Echinococcus multilocularis TaxID=6211 RepID=A0A068YFM5_ECHMU|nr:cation efflux protein: zinc transporter [Echinococcus multilocularis]
MMVLVILYFLVELVTGYVVHSLALVADSFHMLSDFIALCVGVAASRIAKWPRSSKNTFGWQRAEVVGSLVNTIVLVTLCFTIFIDAIERFVEHEPIKDPQIMVYVGVGGLVINMLGLLVIGGHSHSHDTPALTMDIEDVNIEAGGNELEYNLVESKPETGEAAEPIPNGNLGSYEVVDSEYDPGNDADKMLKCCPCFRRMRKLRQSSEKDLGHENCHLAPCSNTTIRKPHKEGHSMNMRAVFLHVFADFLGSIIVVVSALILWQAPGDPTKPENRWKLFIDPAMSIIMVIIILYSTLPLLYKAALILLQSVPKEICIRNLKNRLEKIDGIVRVHDLHVWKLQTNCIIGTVHLRVRSLPEYTMVARRVKQLFHEYNIHCTTIQPEFEDNTEQNPETCLYDCGPNQKCCSDSCCPQLPDVGASGNDAHANVNTSPVPVLLQTSKNDVPVFTTTNLANAVADSTQKTSPIELNRLQAQNEPSHIYCLSRLLPSTLHQFLDVFPTTHRFRGYFHLSRCFFSLMCNRRVSKSLLPFQSVRIETSILAQPSPNFLAAFTFTPISLPYSFVYLYNSPYSLCSFSRFSFLPFFSAR